MTSKIVVNNIQTDAGISSVTLLSHVAGHDSTQNISGINSVTANSFHGDGSNLTGVGASFGNSSVNSSGIATFSQVKTLNGTVSLNKHSVGIGTTTTAGRNAGVSTASGTLNYNTTLKQLEYYDGNKWFQITDSRFTIEGGTQSTFGNYTLFTFTSSGTASVSGSGDIDVLVVGGGGAGGLPSGNSNFGGGGGAGGLVWVTGYNVSSGNYNVVVGNGGAKDNSTNGARGNSGQDSTAFGLTAKGGGGGGSQAGTSTGGTGGSGGGGGYTGGNSGGAAATQPSQSNSGVGRLFYNLGNV